MGSVSRQWLLSALAIVTTVFAVESGGLRVRFGLLAIGLGLAAFALHAIVKGVRVGLRDAIPLLLLGGVVLSTILMARLGRGGPAQLSVLRLDRYALFHDLFLLGAAALLGLASTTNVSTNDELATVTTRSVLRSGLALPLAMIAAFVLGLSAHWLRVGLLPIGWVQDEAQYLFQASLFRLPGFGQPMDDALLPFFAIDHEFLRDGLLRSQYPPGWPFILAAFDRIGLLPIATSLCFALVVLGTYRVAERVSSRENAGLAALLVATSPPLITEASRFFAHLATAALALATATLLIDGARGTGRRRALAWIGAGAVTGIAFSIRPLTALALSAGFGIFVIFWCRLTTREVVHIVAASAAGALVPGLLVLGFNQVTTGDPLVFGYAAANGPLHDLGFGVRGAVRWSSEGVRYLDAAEFAPKAALAGLARILRLMWMEALFGGFGAVILAAALWRGFRPSARVILPMLTLPFAYFFYFYSDSRFASELIPFAIIGIGALTFWLTELQPHFGVRLLWTALLLNVMGSVSLLHQTDQAYSTLRSAMTDVLSSAADGPVVALFHADSSASQALLHGLVSLRSTSDSSRVVGARDLGERNRALLERFPRHRAVRVNVVGDSLIRVEAYR